MDKLYALRATEVLDPPSQAMKHSLHYLLPEPDRHPLRHTIPRRRQSLPKLVDDPSICDLSEAIFQENILEPSGNGVRAVVTETAYEIQRLAYIHMFVDLVIEADRPLKRKRSKAAQERLVNSLKQASKIVTSRPPPSSPAGVRCSENIELFRQVYKRLDFSSCVVHDQLREELIAAIREGTQSPKFRQRKADRKMQCERNYEATVQYISALFATYRRLLVIRVDLHFTREALVTLTYPDVASYLHQFLNNVRHTRFGSEKVGHVWKLEDGHSKGPHIHLTLFLNASDHQSHAFIAEEIGKYWESNITAGKGYFINCHRANFVYHYPALGTIERDNFAKRQNLLRLVRYLTKTDQFMKVSQCRTFGKGRMPDLSRTKRGRPVSSGQQGVQQRN